MPTLSEFIVTIGLRYDEAEDQAYTVFRFETVRQFSIYRYDIDIEDEIDRKGKVVRFVIKGVSPPRQDLATSGPAMHEIAYPALEGTYRLQIAGAKQSGECIVRGSTSKVKMIEDISADFVEIRIDDKVEIIRA